MKLSILHKGLIIIAIPLVFELFFIVVLVGLLDESSKHIKNEIRSQDKVVYVESMIKELADSTTSAILYNVSRDESLKERNSQARKNLVKSYVKLKRLTADDAEESHAVAKLYNSAVQWFNHQDMALSSSPHGRMSTFFFVPGAVEAQRLLVMRPEGPARIVIDKETKARTVDRKLRKQSILSIQILLVFGLIVSITITIILGLYFARYVTLRLSNVLTNTLRLGARMDLEPPLRGDDEIAELDQALHATASEILEFEKFKEQLIGVVSHELRTPLTSVQGTLTLAEAGAMGHFSDRAMKEIEEAQFNLKKLIVLVNDLLLLERLEAGTQVMKKNDFDLAAHLASVLEECRDSIESKSLRVICNFDSLEFQGDQERLLQVLSTLVRSSINRAPQSSEVEISAKETGDKVEIRIVDSGMTLATVRQKSYFDRNRDLDEAEADKGELLQLALSRAIIAAHDGTVEFKHDRGRNALLILLPARKSGSD